MKAHSSVVIVCVLVVLYTVEAIDSISNGVAAAINSELREQTQETSKILAEGPSNTLLPREPAAVAPRVDITKNDKLLSEGAVDRIPVFVVANATTAAAQSLPMVSTNVLTQRAVIGAHHRLHSLGSILSAMKKLRSPHLPVTPAAAEEEVITAPRASKKVKKAKKHIKKRKLSARLPAATTAEEDEAVGRMASRHRIKKFMKKAPIPHTTASKKNTTAVVHKAAAHKEVLHKKAKKAVLPHKASPHPAVVAEAVEEADFSCDSCQMACIRMCLQAPMVTMCLNNCFSTCNTDNTVRCSLPLITDDCAKCIDVGINSLRTAQNQLPGGAITAKADDIEERSGSKVMKQPVSKKAPKKKLHKQNKKHTASITPSKPVVKSQPKTVQDYLSNVQVLKMAQEFAHCVQGNSAPVGDNFAQLYASFSYVAEQKTCRDFALSIATQFLATRNPSSTAATTKS